jgi:hypothetical protein
MSDSDIVDDVDVEEIDTGGGKVKRVVAALGILAVLFVVLKLRGGSSAEAEADDEDASSGVEHVGDDEDPIDTVSTSDDDESEAEGEDDEDDTLEVKSSSDDIAGGRFDELDLVDYLAIFAAALQSARDEYRIRTER